MKVRLTRTARITHQPGEIVEVSPTEARFLLSTGSAEAVSAQQPETPEAAAVVKPKTARKKG